MTFTFMHLADAKVSYTAFKVYIELILVLPGNRNYDCHGCARGSRNEETRIETNRVFNVEQTEEAQEHR